MKKIIFISLITLILLPLALTTQAAGATLSISTGKTTYGVGDVFSLPISINSGGNQLQVVRAKITYPADLLQAQGFTLGSLFSQKSPGGSIGNGVIYEGGYRLGDGTSDNGLFGTATFKVLKNGSATIALVAGSRIITAEPKDIYGGGNSITLTLGKTTAPPTEEKKEGKKTTTPKLITPAISSSTHPQDTWKKNNTVNFNWNNTAGNSGYILKLAQEPLDDIGTQVTTTKNSYTYEGIKDGIWYFHLRAKYPNGYSKIVYYTIKVDTTPPNAPQPVIEGQINPGGENIYQIFFATTDLLSDIDSYELKFDGGQFKKVNSPYTLSPAEKEAKWVTVKAIDKAGNEIVGSANITKYIVALEDAWFQAQQEKTTLFDIQAESANRSWLEFYATLSLVGLIFIIVVIGIVIKKRK